MDHEKYFRLETGEKIIESIKPKMALMWHMILKSLGSIMIFLLPFLLAFAFMTIGTSPYRDDFPHIPGELEQEIKSKAIDRFLSDVFSNPFIIVAGLIMLCLPFATAFLSYSKKYYWITDNRVIYKTGLIGYRIVSIPLERISDIIITRGFWENIFGYGSLHVQSMAGQFTGGRGYRGTRTRGLGSEGQLLAVPNPEALQKLIFELIKKKRKSEKLTM